jgi:aspartate racemase
MKKIGIVGGLTWLSTIDYYAAICRMGESYAAANGACAPLPAPELIIESLDVAHAFRCIGTDGDEASWRAFDAYHRDALLRLQAGGARLALLAANTPHHRFASIVRGVDIPVVNIFEEVAKTCAALAVTDVLVLGTALTMSSPVLRDAMARYAVTAFSPASAEDRSLVVEIIAELQTGSAPDARRRLADLSKRCFAERPHTRIAVSLACTELPLAFPDSNGAETFVRDDILYLNTSAIHARAAFDLAVHE